MILNHQHQLCDALFSLSYWWPDSAPVRTTGPQRLAVHHEITMPLKKKIERCTKSAVAIREIAILTAQTGEGEFSETADRAKVNPACQRMYRHTSKDSSLAGHVCENYESREGTRVSACDRKCYIVLVVELYGGLMIPSAAYASSLSGVDKLPVRGSAQRLVRSQRTQNQRGSWDRYSSRVDVAPRP